VIEDVARRALDRRLAKVAGTYHMYNGRPSAEPTSIWLTFDGMPPYRFAGASDGWRLLVDSEAPKEFTMQESGAVRLRDMSATPSFGRVMDQPVRKVWLIVSPTPDDVVGVRFDFDGATVRILNWGDEMYVGSEWPQGADSSEISERLIR
jgi:hypothetical protein